MDIYQSVIRPVLFSGLNADPEWLHQQTLSALGWLDKRHRQLPAHWLHDQLARAYCLTDDRLTQSLWGLPFRNPIGLAAGFDKDGVASGVWSSFGFGFAELGTVTFRGQPGNPLPRLFRFPLDKAVLNRMGFNNHGAAAMAETLQQRWNVPTPYPSPLTPTPFPIGINLGKAKSTPLEEAAADYLGSFQLLKDWGSYFVVNVSSPNTPGLRSLQAADQLEPILAALQQENTAQKPLLIKIAPDLEWDAIAAVLELAQKHSLAGIIATNTTIRRDGLTTQIVRSTGKAIQEEAGGISGAPLRQRSTEVIRFIWAGNAGQATNHWGGWCVYRRRCLGKNYGRGKPGASLYGLGLRRSSDGAPLAGRITAKMAARGLTSLSQAIGFKE